MTIIRCRSSFPGRPERDVHWPDGTSIFEALRAGGQPIASSCSGATVCGRCLVQVHRGGAALTPPEPDEARLLARRSAEAGERLACRLYREDEATVVVVSAHYW